jgi:hypothetical protein
MLAFAVRSTRINIVEQSLADTLERLSELGASARVRELRMKAQGFDRAVKAWSLTPPTEQQRQAMMKLVLELNVEVIQVSKEQS